MNCAKRTRYNWCLEKTNFLKFFNINLIDNILFESFDFFKKENKSNNQDYNSNLQDIIIFKKKTSMFKKNYNNRYLILSRSIFKSNTTILGSNFHKKDNHFNELVEFKDEEYKQIISKKNKNSPNFNKSFDFSRNIKLLIKKNRILLKNIIKSKFKRQYRLDKIFSKIVKRDSNSTLMNLEFRLSDILLKCQFFNNYSDCSYFIKNGLVLVNGSICLNPKKTLNYFDVVNLKISSKYYIFYRSSLSNSSKVVSKFGNLLWRINKNLYSDKKIEPNDKIPDWSLNYIYFRGDVPKFLEVDYKSMSIVVLEKKLRRNDFDYFNTKFLNLYSMRSYNWKTIV